ncbi:gfo/Idh/MocA family oxidoreductase [candidate division KSB1 bacterium]|nr:MAG: gfo/Idh/MocA family oxidoreductase [candidate division KSB1 bacterium]
MQEQAGIPSKAKLDRRRFIQTAAAGALAMSTMVSRKAFAQDKIKIGLIGCGWYGMVDMKAAFKVGGVECIAICDVDTEHLAAGAAEIDGLQGFKPATFKDYRQLLEHPELQAVIIATPPHWHALQFIAALERGVDIYCEKPLAYDIREGQAMVEAAKSDHIIQIGFQRRKATALREAREFIQAGNIGDIAQVDVQIHYNAVLRDATPQEPPASLDWDAWCGPAPKLPYSPNIGHFAWRLEKEYGHGHLVDWGIHMIDTTRWILDDGMPTTVRAFGGIYKLQGAITTPDSLTVNFDFSTCPVTWRHRLWGAQEYTPETNNGIFFFGDKGTVFASDHQWAFIPKDGERQMHAARNDAGRDIMADFLQAVKTRDNAGLHSPQDAFCSTATTQLGMIAYESDSVVKWDAATKEVVDNRAAAMLLKRPYRAPWQHPFEA